METEKKQWQKPELIVLVRGKPEEAVLAGCKLSPRLGSGKNFYDVCHDYPCGVLCEDLVGS